MTVRSKALEVNLADYHVDVDIHPRFVVLEQVMAVYSGMHDEFKIFLEELSHPYKNQEFIIKKARRYCLDYFYLFRNHPDGHKGVGLYMDIFLDVLLSASTPAVKTDAVDNMLLYIQKIIRESGDAFIRFSSVLDDAFDRIGTLDDHSFDYVVKSYYSLTQTGEILVLRDESRSQGFQSLNRLLIRYLTCTCRYFIEIKDPLEWFSEHTGESSDSPEAQEIFHDISRDTLGKMWDELRCAGDEDDLDSAMLTKKLAAFPGFSIMVKHYRNVTRKLYEAGSDTQASHRWKLLFLFHIMGINGLGLIHEDALRDINRTMKAIIEIEKQADVLNLMDQAFPILKKWVGRYPDAALNCVLSMGEGIYKTDDVDFVNFFIDRVIELGFKAPSPEGKMEENPLKTNSDHLLNIRIWMKIIELNPKWSTRLMSALIIHLSTCGIVIKDTDLFPRDITRFLGGRIEPVYYLSKQLARLFPAYFNDIGAEGLLRDISTEIDELCQRRDLLVHYIRKQSHVESSNRLPRLLENLFEFWKDGRKEHLEHFIPDYLYQDIGPEDPYFEGVHGVVNELHQQAMPGQGHVLSLPSHAFGKLMKKVRAGSEKDRKRVSLAHSFYTLLCQKYRPDVSDLDTYISGLESKGFAGIEALRAIISESDSKNRLYKLLSYLEKLKNLINSDKEYEIIEDIYQKRHITVDIPSMYGSYHEARFNAMGLTFRLESLVNVLFEEYTHDVDLSLITKATFFQIYNRLMLFDNALKIDGIQSREYEKQLNLMIVALGSSGFTFTQYLDIMKGFVQAVRNIVNVYFTNIYKLNLDRILPQLDQAHLFSKYRSSHDQEDSDKLKLRVSEMFFREKISQVLGLQQLDLFLSRILTTLYNQADILPEQELRLLLNYDPQRAMAGIDKNESQALGIVALGNKGLNLCRMTGFGWPVPPGFIITTEVFRCRRIITSYPNADVNFNHQLLRHIRTIETRTGKRFGDPKNPLLLSVRSGSSISQPGMMDSLLNVGMNPEIAEAIANDTGNTWFAWDNYRRFLQCYGMAFDLERDDFDLIINEYKKEIGVRFKRLLTGQQMCELAMKYRDFIIFSGVSVQDDPFEQLKICLWKVMESWNLPKAKVYRSIMGISHDWGTAVTVQGMVFGNISNDSGSGVIFTHNPKLPGDTLKLWGDFTIGNQGEDVASGLVNTLPISNIQKGMEQRNTDISLETHFPEIFNLLKYYAADLIRNRNWSPQEMEFTFESPKAKDLYILQTRDMVFTLGQKKPMFDVEDQRFQNSLVAHGIGVSGGAMSGRIVFSLTEIDSWRKIEPETCLILIRNDTVPDDIKEIYAADGLLTARGGITSHASVVAHRLEKTCVVGCSELICDEKNKVCRLGPLEFKSGEFMSINGQEGSIYQGFFEVKE
ncbi:MAG: pyruvate, phosphate dikinase [Proteobacteria bacterium]|nr:pyruvate, phosphate dikinase [Pseudomonadota bacterium]